MKGTDQWSSVDENGPEICVRHSTDESMQRIECDLCPRLWLILTCVHDHCALEAIDAHIDIHRKEFAAFMAERN